MNRAIRRAERFQHAGNKPVTGRQVFGGFVPFAADPSATTADGWTVLAYEVAMKGSDVALTKRDFEDCVANFKRYPCVPVAIEHADTDFSPFTQPPKEWREPNGHVEDLRVGTFQRNGKVCASLEGKVSYLEPTAADVAAKKWRFGSITIIQGAIDEETGAALGSMLWSWSLTAHPRLTGLPAIAASRRAPDGTVEAGWWYGDIDDRDDLLSMLRTVLDLPVTSTEAEVLAELVKLEGLVADSAAAEASGIDVECIVGRIRDALRLPALTTTTEVLDEVRKGLATMPTETPAAPAAMPSMSSRGAAAQPSHTEKPMKFSLILAALGMAAATTEEDAEKRVTAAAQFGLDALKAVGLPPTATPAEYAAKVSSLSAAAAKVPALETELTTFRAEAAKRTEADREAYLNDLVAARPELASVRASLALHAQTDFVGFSAAYPRPGREELITAAAEKAQRGHDPARTTPVTASGRPSGEAPKAPAAGTDRKAIAAVLDEYGHASDAAAVTSANAMGHTVESLKAALAQA